MRHNKIWEKRWYGVIKTSKPYKILKTKGEIVEMKYKQERES